MSVMTLPGGETVVVAEDEHLIRMLVTEFLTDEGFVVHQAEHAAHALTVLETEAASVHVLFTDVRMPGEMNGVQLARHVSVHWPWIKLFVTSAHLQPLTEDLPEGCAFVPKPYDLMDVARRVRIAMASGGTQ